MRKKSRVIVALVAFLAVAAGFGAVKQPRFSTENPQMALGPEISDWPLLFPTVTGYQLPDVGSYHLPPLEAAADGLLLDPHGDDHQLSALLDGRVSLVSFVYLLCGDANGCPLALSILYELYHSSAKIPALSDHLQLLTVSFDPERDTPEALQSFFYPLSVDSERQSKIPWLIFTPSSEDEMRSLTDGFGQVVDRRPDSEVIEHLLRMYLIDRQGRVRNIYGLGMIDPGLIISDVVTLLMEDQVIVKSQADGRKAVF